MFCWVFNICRIEIYTNNNIKEKKGEMEVYCYIFFTIYIKLCDMLKLYSVKLKETIKIAQQRVIAKTVNKRNEIIS